MILGPSQPNFHEVLIAPSLIQGGKASKSSWANGATDGLVLAKLRRCVVFSVGITNPNLIYLVGGFNPSEKNLVSWDDYSQYIEKKIKTVPNPRPIYIYILVWHLFSFIQPFRNCLANL
jgi:hypothetical protein